MRWIVCTILPFVAAPLSAQENEAEKLFRAMEKKVRAAKSVEIAFEGDIASKSFKMKLKGRVLGQGELFRIEATGEFGGKSVAALVLSDGKTIYNKEAGESKARAKTRPASAGDGDMVRGIAGRVGVVQGVGVVDTMTSTQRSKDLDFDAAVLPVKDFILGAKEKVGGKDAQVIECAVTTPKDKITGKMLVWIDSQTQLPLKRSIERIEHGETVTVVETYTTFALDAKIDRKVFELPE
jgi:outer membrane lipoprotein-sorting protein